MARHGKSKEENEPSDQDHLRVIETLVSTVPSQEGLYRHFARMADALHVRVAIYSDPLAPKLWPCSWTKFVNRSFPRLHAGRCVISAAGHPDGLPGIESLASG